MKKKADLETELFHIGLIFLAAGAVLWTGYCLIREQLPQLPCVVSCLLHGKLLLSFWYHPLVPYTAILFGGFMITQALNRLGLRRIRAWKFHSWYLYAGIAITAGNFVIKNLLRIVWGIVMV